MRVCILKLEPEKTWPDYPTNPVLITSPLCVELAATQPPGSLTSYGAWELYIQKGGRLLNLKPGSRKRSNRGKRNGSKLILLGRKATSLIRITYKLTGKGCSTMATHTKKYTPIIAITTGRRLFTFGKQIMSKMQMQQNEYVASFGRHKTKITNQNVGLRQQRRRVHKQTGAPLQ